MFAALLEYFTIYRELIPIASHNPARNSTAPVQATWNALDPGRYQKPHAPCTGIMLMNPTVTVAESRREEESGEEEKGERREEEIGD